MSKLTKAQENFILGVKDHVTYRVIGRHMSAAKALQELDFITIQDGYFAYLTESGKALKQDLRKEK